MKKRQLFSCGLGVRHLWITAVSAVNTLGLCCRITQGKEPGQAPMSSLKIDTMVSGDRRVAAAPCSVLTLPGLVLFPLPTDTEKPFLKKKNSITQRRTTFLVLAVEHQPLGLNSEGAVSSASARPICDDRLCIFLGNKHLKSFSS